MMNKIVFLLAACLLMVHTANSSKLFKRNDGMAAEPLDDLEATTTNSNQSCGSCQNMVFEIKCGGEYGGDGCGDCSLFCDCKDATYPGPTAGPPTNVGVSAGGGGSGGGISGGPGNTGSGFGSGFGFGSANATTTGDQSEVNVMAGGGGSGGGTNGY